MILLSSTLGVIRITFLNSWGFDRKPWSKFKSFRVLFISTDVTLGKFTYTLCACAIAPGARTSLQSANRREM